MWAGMKLRNYIISRKKNFITFFWKLEIDRYIKFDLICVDL